MPISASDGFRPGPILIVDDEPAMRAAVTAILVADGYEVLTAADGILALESVEARRPALILLDIRMPRMDGIVFAHEYHRRAVVPAPIVVVTASVDGAQWMGATGAVSHVSKPFDIDTLLGAVAEHARAPA